MLHAETMIDRNDSDNYMYFLEKVCSIHQTLYGKILIIQFVIALCGKFCH